MIPLVVSNEIFADIQNAMEILYNDNHHNRLSGPQRLWSRNKSHLYELFGNQLIISRPVDDITHSHQQLVILFGQEVYKHNHNYIVAKVVFQGFAAKEITHNRLCKNIDVYGKIFLAGTKVSKILQEVVPEDHRDAFNVQYSMFRQKLRAAGRLCISIDPRDFLTMSVNNAGWSTCQHISGERGTATFSLMQDTVTAVIYVAKEKTEVLKDLKGLEWNSKTWRQLVHICVQTGRIVLSEHYPFQASHYTNLALEMLGQQFCQYTQRDTITLVPYNESIMDMINVEETYVHNDLAYKYGHMVYCAEMKSTWWTSGTTIHVGSHKIYCVKCGEEAVDMEEFCDRRTILCDDCI